MCSAGAGEADGCCLQPRQVRRGGTRGSAAGCCSLKLAAVELPSY